MIRRTLLRILPYAFSALFGLGMASTGLARDAVTVIIVRHAEKMDSSTDPDLCESGQQRSLRLASMLQDTGVTALYATQYQRTQQTLQPLAGHLGVPLTVLPADDVEGLISALLRERPGTVAVVASHSNVIPLLLKQLKLDEEVAIGDSDYDNLFVVTLVDSLPIGFLRLKF